MAYDENDSISRLLERSEQVIFDISASRDQNDLMSIGDILPLSYDTLAKMRRTPAG